MSLATSSFRRQAKAELLPAMIFRLRRVASTRCGGRLLADLGVAWRDGREPAHTLVQGLDTAAFELFPEGDRAVFRISDGAFPGLWVRTLE